ncbi:stevor PIR protein, putative [Plasmodium reichenowi]|uniref:Stevor PIR protein, putative n=1 Tax=Plasmodium reichenowi TaxID=5854 RepID=A0A2P9DT56_PLARE|nr:stevor PIR protein, putative [Plasmodium reichenowi]
MTLYIKHKYRKGTDNNEKEAKSNGSSRSSKYLEMQRKLYNNFYVKPEIYFENFSDKSYDYSKNKSSDKSSSSNKVHDNYLENLKTGCVRTVGIDAVSSLAIEKCGIAAAKVALQPSLSVLGIELVKLAEILSGLSYSSANSIKGSFTSVGVFKVTNAIATNSFAKATTTSNRVFFYYGISIYIIIAPTTILILLYVWFLKRRKKSIETLMQKTFMYVIVFRI